MDNYHRACRVEQIRNATLLVLMIDYGYGQYGVQPIRLHDVMLPQPRADQEPAKRFISDWLEAHGRGQCGQRHHWPFVVESTTLEQSGRYAGVLRCREDHRLNEALLQAGFVVPYNPYLR